MKHEPIGDAVLVSVADIAALEKGIRAYAGPNAISYRSVRALGVLRQARRAIQVDSQHSPRLSLTPNDRSACDLWVKLISRGSEAPLWVEAPDGNGYLLKWCRYEWPTKWLRRGLHPRSASLGTPSEPVAVGRAWEIFWRDELEDKELEQLFSSAYYGYESRVPEQLKSALEQFQQIERICPRYPWAPSLGFCTRELLSLQGCAPRPQPADLAALREKVRRVQRDCYSAFIAEGIYLYHNYQVRTAIAQFQRAADLYPKYYAAWKWLAEAYMTVGEVELALTTIEDANRRAEYKMPLLRGIQAYLLVQAGRPQQALNRLTVTDSRFKHPKNCVFAAMAHLDLALQALETNDEYRAAAHLLEAEKLHNEAELIGESKSVWFLNERLQIYALGRDLPLCRDASFADRAADIGQRLQSHPESNDHPGQEARRWVALGYDEMALAALERAVSRRDPLVLNMEREPHFRRLRCRPAFKILCDLGRSHFHTAANGHVEVLQACAKIGIS